MRGHRLRGGPLRLRLSVQALPHTHRRNETLALPADLLKAFDQELLLLVT
ncbi:hypothetical protein ACH427_22825 [Streptomyces sp. NPDC020379]